MSELTLSIERNDELTRKLSFLMTWKHNLAPVRLLVIAVIILTLFYTVVAIQTELRFKDKFQGLINVLLGFACVLIVCMHLLHGLCLLLYCTYQACAKL